MPTLGPFRLQRSLERGGTATVWLAVHERHDEPVAIKIMHAKQVRRARFVASFHREVRAVARMNHPNILRVFDYGEVSEQAAQRSEGQLVTGSPYIVMELADSTLARIDHGHIQWPHIHAVLAHILDALAHAHARGLIHRDLKPENILFLSNGSDTKISISDFGVAYALNAMDKSGDDIELITGTPRYMAPEQIQGQLREQGPWTDLYALGCLIYWLSTGSPPFTQQRNAEVLRAHLTESRPPLEPMVEVPEGFDEWTYRLMARDPAQRFRRAADAASALAEIAGDMPRADVTLSARTSDGDSVDWLISEDPEITRILEHTWAMEEPLQIDEMPEAQDWSIEPLPDLPGDWRTDHREADSIEMVGVGLDLFALREIPLVGRHDHRDQLWKHLVDARYTGRPHAVVLDGPAGIGKTRLASWLGHRAHEVGAVEVLTAHHSPIAGPADGLSRMFANHLRCTGLSRDEITKRIRNFYESDGKLAREDFYQCVALTQLIAPGADPDFDQREQLIRFGRPEERYVVWKRLLAKLGRRRPLLLVLDDVHWGSNALRFVRYLLNASKDADLPILVVLTLRSEIIEEASLAAEYLAEIVARPCAEKLRVGPLTSEDHRALIENLLRLEPEVAERVAQRTDGNPLFAIQLVGDWIDRGLLEVGEDGFCLAEGQQPPLPRDIETVLVKRLEEIVGQSVDQPAQPALLSLELAAVLGHDVDKREWRLLCKRGGLRPPADLLDLLAGQSLVRLGLHGWSFTHGALRETLLAVAAQQGRLKDHHRLCAAMLEQLYDVSQDKLAPRLAGHMLEATDFEAALEPLANGLRHYVKTCDFDAAERFFERHEDTRRQLGADDSDRRAIRARLEMVRMYGRKRQLDEAEELLDECQSFVESQSDPDVMAELLLLRAKNRKVYGNHDAAREFAERAQELFERVGDEKGRGYSLVERGSSLLQQNKNEPALPLLKEALRCFMSIDDRAGSGRCLYYLGLANWRDGKGNTARAIDLLHRAQKAHEELGDRLGISHCLNGLGEVYRQRGDLKDAESVYRQAIEINEQLGVAERNAVLHINLGITRLQRGDFNGALPCMAKALVVEEATSQRRPLIGGALAGLAAAMAGRTDWDCFDDYLDRLQQLLNDESFAEYDVAFCLEIAADQARQKGALARARRAYRLALKQWREVGESEKVAATEAQLDSLAESMA